MLTALLAAIAVSGCHDDRQPNSVTTAQSPGISVRPGRTAGPPGTTPTARTVRVTILGAQGIESESTFTSDAEALAFAQSKADFSLALPGWTPPGFGLASIQVSPKPQGPGPHRVRFGYQGNQAGLSLMAVNTPFDFPGKDADHQVTSLTPGTELYRAAADGRTEFTLLSETRGYVLTINPGAAISDADAVRMLGSLPTK